MVIPKNSIMKKQIRKNIFETNSSSTHAVSIFRGSNYVIPERIEIYPGEFGWECREYSSPEAKLSYLYTWILSKCMSYEYNEVTEKYDDKYDYKKLKDYQYRIKSKLLEAGVKEVEFNKCSGWFEEGYIDHSEDLYNDDLETILEDYFLDYVFNPASYIETGNDNDESEVCEAAGADFSIYKGN